jgi:acetoin utilization deacetylase AcuC-like enzyme
MAALRADPQGPGYPLTSPPPKPLKAFYTDSFVLPLPPGHRFPMAKYAGIREIGLSMGVLHRDALELPPAATLDELVRVHTADYLQRVFDGRLSDSEQRRIGFPWSAEMVERSRRSVGATIAAGRHALAEAAAAGWGIAANLAGGTHHAYPDHGEGFCVFNDAAVAIRAWQAEGTITRAAVVDLDVHQGNGTANIFASDPSVFTLSIHGAKNYPFRRERSTIDVDLPDHAGDELYLHALDLHLPSVFSHAPEIVVYLAGADPYKDDRFGRLALSKAGLRARDEMVLSECRRRSIPVVITMAGGYGRDTADTVEIHVATLDVAARLGREENVR